MWILYLSKYRHNRVYLLCLYPVGGWTEWEERSDDESCRNTQANEALAENLNNQTVRFPTFEIDEENIQQNLRQHRWY